MREGMPLYWATSAGATVTILGRNIIISSIGLVHLGCFTVEDCHHEKKQIGIYYSMGIHLIEVLNQVLVADEAHTA
jgi:hypothetical protein